MIDPVKANVNEINEDKTLNEEEKEFWTE